MSPSTSEEEEGSPRSPSPTQVTGQDPSSKGRKEEREGRKEQERNRKGKRNPGKDEGK